MTERRRPQTRVRREVDIYIASSAVLCSSEPDQLYYIIKLHIRIVGIITVELEQLLKMCQKLDFHLQP